MKSYFVILLFCLIQLCFAQNCLENTTDIVIGGGRDGVCEISCNVKKSQGYVCYSEVTYHYDIWYGLMLFGFIGTLGWTIKCLLVMLSLEKFKLNTQFTTMLINCGVLLSRIIWLGCSYDGRVPSVQIGGHIMEKLIISLGQIFLIVEIFGIILVWKTLVDSSKSMKKIGSKDSTKNKRLTIGLSLFLIIFMTPITILSIFFPFLNNIRNFILLAHIIGLIIGGTKYAINIKKMLSKGVRNKKIKSAVESVLFVTFCFNVVGIVALVFIVLNALGTFNDPYLKVWLWWFVVHCCEIVILFCIPYSISSKSRTAKKERRSLGSVYDTSTKVTTKVTTKVNTKIEDSVA